MAIMFGVKMVAKPNRHLLVQTDNRAAIRYVNKLGGTHLNVLCSIAIQLHKYCVTQNTVITAEHLPGMENVLADKLSRQLNQDWSDWSLAPSVFKDILKQTNLVPSIDLFASRLNSKLKIFMSWRPDPDAAGINAFVQHWGSLHCPYIFPPFILIGRVLTKIKRDQVHQGILIVTHWPSSRWWPALLSVLRQTP